MKKIVEALHTMGVAARYSLAFCLRNSRKSTIGRVSVSITNTLVLYLGIQATGLIFNTVQRVMARHPVPYSFSAFTLDFQWPILFFVGVLLAGVVTGRLNWFFASEWNTRLQYANRQEIDEFSKTLDISVFESQKRDDLLRQIRELPTGEQSRYWFSQELLNMIATTISFALFGSALLWYKPVYALIIFLVSVPMMMTEFTFVSKWWELYESMVPLHKKRHVLEAAYRSTEAFRQGHIFNQMPTLRTLIQSNVDDVIGSYEKLRVLNVRREMITHTLAALGLIGVVIHLLWSTVAHGGEFGTLSVIVAAARTFQGNMESIVGSIADQWKTAKGVILIEKDYFGLKPMIETLNPIEPEFKGPPRIRFNRVSYAYPEKGENQVLSDVSFSIEPGAKTAIVGKSGNGKSTILELLLRQRDPTSGAIFAGDIDLRNIEPEVWVQYISALTQKFTVLSRTVGEEIASSRINEPIDSKALIEAANFANFMEVVEEDPLGFETQIGTEFGGKVFSGGENQRLALARVHYRRTPIIVLDEPDASLDAESAQKVFDQIFAMTGITVIIITHHISRAARCDKVIMMGKGEVVEQGTPTELLALGGAYAKMFSADQERLGAKLEADSEKVVE